MQRARHRLNGGNDVLPLRCGDDLIESRDDRELIEWQWPLIDSQLSPNSAVDGVGLYSTGDDLPYYALNGLNHYWFAVMSPHSKSHRRYHCRNSTNH